MNKTVSSVEVKVCIIFDFEGVEIRIKKWRRISSTKKLKTWQIGIPGDLSLLRKLPKPLPDPSRDEDHLQRQVGHELQHRHEMGLRLQGCARYENRYEYGLQTHFFWILDQEKLKEGDEDLIVLSFKSYFTSEVNIVICEDSFEFNTQEVGKNALCNR